MEHIRKALERAEERRAETPPSLPAGTVAPRPEQNRRAAAYPATSEVTYHRTKVIDVSADTLERQRLVAGMPGNPLTDVLFIHCSYVQSAYSLVADLTLRG